MTGFLAVREAIVNAVAHTIRNPKSDGVSFFFAYCTRVSLLSITGRIFVLAKIGRLKLSVILDMTTMRKKGKYTACIKVIDVFGCDTSISVEINI